MSVMKHFDMTTIKLAHKVTVLAVIYYHIGSYFAHRLRRKNVYHSVFLKKIVLITRIWRKSVFSVWQLSTLVPIKMSVSSLTLGFSIVSKKQLLF